MRVYVSHDTVSHLNAVCTGLLRVDLTPATSFASLGGMSGILDVIELPADVATRITDVWITVTQAFGSGTTISVGDGDADDHFLLPTDVTVAGDQGVDLVHKGQKLNTNATALVKTKITLGIAATSVLSSMSAGQLQSIYYSMKSIRPITTRLKPRWVHRRER